MRLIVTRILWSFDLELSEESDKWIEQEAYWTWHRPPLLMRLKERPTREIDIGSMEKSSSG